MHASLRLSSVVLLLLAHPFDVVFAGYAPSEGPKLPAGWCAEKEGTLTRSTGECMCRYGCEGRGCQSGQGMIWYAFKECKSGCRCTPKPGSSVREAEGGDGPARDSVASSFGAGDDEEDPVQCSEKKPCDSDGAADGDGGPAGDEEDESEETQAYVDAKQKRVDADVKWKAEVEARKAKLAQEDEEDEEALDGQYHEGYNGEEDNSEEELAFSEAAMEWMDDNWRMVFGITVILLLSCTLLPSLFLVPNAAPSPSSRRAPAAATATTSSARDSPAAESRTPSEKKKVDIDATTKEQ